MPRHSPFTRLCQAAAKLAAPSRVDLHTHSMASDGDFTPSQLVVQARAAGLAAIALTDHDTTAGIAEARATVFATKPVEVLAGVEISTHHDGKSYHLLAYFIDLDNPALQQRLAEIRSRRTDRFEQFLAAFQRDGVTIPPHLLDALNQPGLALGRRHLAKLLVESGHANTLQIAFQKYLLPQAIPSFHNIAMAEAIETVHDAGGITSLAHPPAELSFDTFSSMHALGLDAVEANCPSVAYGFGETLTAWAHSLGLLTTAASDYHGSNSVLGSRTVTLEHLAILRERAARSGAVRV